MATKKTVKEKKSISPLEEKARKWAGDEVIDALLGSSDEELSERLVALAKHEQETEESLLTNEGVQEVTEKFVSAKQAKTETEGPFKDTLKSINAQRRLIAKTLEERGK